MSVFNNARVWQGATIISGAGLWWIKRKADRDNTSLQAQLRAARNDVAYCRHQVFFDGHPTEHISIEARVRLLEATYEIMHPGDWRFPFATYCPWFNPKYEPLAESDQTFLKQLLQELEEISGAMNTLREENAKLKSTPSVIGDGVSRSGPGTMKT